MACLLPHALRLFCNLSGFIRHLAKGRHVGRRDGFQKDVLTVGEHGKPGTRAESKLLAQVAWNDKLSF